MPDIDLPTRLLAQVEQLRRLGWSLTGAYPYAAALGGALRQQQPDWYEEYRCADPDGAGLALDQAANYRFLAFAESNWAGPAFDAALAQALATSGRKAWIVELEATVAWMDGSVGA